MRKQLFILLLLFSLNNVEAQVVLEKGNLKETFDKAKTENKIVMLIGSATW